MDLQLTRRSCNPWGVLSQLSDYHGLLQLNALEHAYLQPSGLYLPKIPNGIYPCVLGTHQLKHGPPFKTYMITGVPGHTGILFHHGNTEEDSEGCVLLGTELGYHEILNSDKAFQEFMLAQAMQNQFMLTVS